ncbi:hypothetical protein F5Y06DRAFT_299130 [Hypoxylon sp. FL0890]|nr:hypothetical protein F5Y06DRAFT_299130 [Hypoxylon sp. FL0890]
MGDTGETSSQQPAGEKQTHPDQADAVSVATSCQTLEGQPDYQSKMTQSVTTTATPYRPFPSIMKAFYQWNLSGFKVFYLCGPGGEQDRLFAVEQHTGFSFSGPLGVRPGMILETLAGVRPYAFNPRSIILLPPPTPDSKSMVREEMRARSSGHEVAFQFSLEVGQGEKTRRETFEWKKIKKAEKDEEAKQGGFKLLRVQSSTISESSSQARSSSSSLLSVATADSGSEVLALFAWTKTLSNLKHPFTLELKIDGLTSGLGETWTLAVVVTALRLWMLHAYGKTNWPIVAASDKIRGK